MRRTLINLTILIAALALFLGCATLFPARVPLPTALPGAIPPPQFTPTVAAATGTAPTPSRSPASPPLPSATATPILPAVRCPLPTEVCIGPTDVHLHPPSPAGDGVAQVFSGDQVTFEIRAHCPLSTPQCQLPAVAVYLGAVPHEPAIARGQFGAADLGGQSEALIPWAWNTTGLSGTQTLTVVLDPDAPTSCLKQFQQGRGDTALSLMAQGFAQRPDCTQVLVDVRPADQRPADEIGAHWAQTETDCCILYYVTGTASERDLARLTELANASMAQIEQKLDEHPKQKFVITFTGRVLGQGGYADGEAVLSYLDRDYAGGILKQVFMHEGTHVLDHNFAPARLAMLGEGLAVYTAGGHFRPEPLPQRAVALLALGRMIPLRQLADNFYQSQHEIGYLEAAAFTQYLIDTYGLADFKSFYGSFKPDDPRPQSQQLDAALRSSFGVGLDEMEQRWLASLKALGPQPDQERDLRDTIAFYDTVRRYQQDLDRTAYFLDAWLPDFGEARKRGVVADALRHPTTPENITLEAMLIAADTHFDAREYDAGERLLASVNAVLDTINVGSAPRFDDPVAAQYLAIVRAVGAVGYEAQQIMLTGPAAQVKAIRTWPELVQLNLQLQAGQWVVQ